MFLSDSSYQLFFKNFRATSFLCAIEIPSLFDYEVVILRLLYSSFNKDGNLLICVFVRPCICVRTYSLKISILPYRNISFEALVAEESLSLESTLSSKEIAAENTYQSDSCGG
jgi:hypothetical protein